MVRWVGIFIAIFRLVSFYVNVCRRDIGRMGERSEWMEMSKILMAIRIRNYICFSGKLSGVEGNVVGFREEC